MALQLADFVIHRKVFPTIYEKTVHVILQLQEMAASEILGHVSKEELDRIKQTDPHPEFRAYVVAHEGVSEGSLVGGGNIVKRWFRSAIQKVFDFLKIGVKVFHDHNVDNTHEGRESIGHVVGRVVKQVKDKLTAIAIMYIKPAFRHLPLDVASIEADIRIDPSKDRISPVDVKRLTGIALGSSMVRKPGFTGAELLSSIQAFADSRSPRKFERSSFMGEAEKITIDELRQLVKAEKISPSDIFTVEQLTGDPSVQGYVEAEKKRASAGEFAHRKRTDEKFDEERGNWEKEKKEKDDKIAKLTKIASESKVKTLMEDAKEKRKLTDEQQKFIEKRLDTFQPKEVDTIDKDFDDHLDKELDEFKEIAGVFGIKTEDKKKEGDNGGDKDKEKETDEEDGGDVDNPFLPKLDDE